MKVTALIEAELIEELVRESGAKNITEGLKIAIKDYLAKKKLIDYSSLIVAEPLEFKYGAEYLREQNRQ
jgi:hypothetical protein